MNTIFFRTKVPSTFQSSGSLFEAGRCAVVLLLVSDPNIENILSDEFGAFLIAQKQLHQMRMNNEKFLKTNIGFK